MNRIARVNHTDQKLYQIGFWFGSIHVVLICSTYNLEIPLYSLCSSRLKKRISTCNLLIKWRIREREREREREKESRLRGRVSVLEELGNCASL